MHQIKNSSSPLEISNLTCIDGPPSSEHIRAYTEQMKRSSTFGIHSRTHTISSLTSTIISRKSSLGSSDGNLSRRASGRSTTSGMTHRDRHDSHNIFGRNLFARKPRRGNGSSHGSSMSFAMAGDMREGDFMQEQMHRKPGNRRQISEPYNFQHVTHTRQEQLPNLDRTSPLELVTEFSAIRASQAPSHGNLKGIRAQDLHFEDLSLQRLAATPSPRSGVRPYKSPRHHGHSTRSQYFPESPTPRRPMNRSQSHDNLSAFLPSRTPRPPLSPPCPIEPPTRTSSRSAAVFYTGGQTSLPPTTVERPYTHAGIRRPAPFGIPQQLQPSPNLSKQLPPANEIVSHAVTTPGNEAWPLTAPRAARFDLAEEFRGQSDEETIAARRRSRTSSTSSKLRSHKSVPSLSLRSREQDFECCIAGNELGRTISNITDTTAKAPRSPICRVRRDSWEVDIDYCYEHEAEAHCDYNWERRSLDQSRGMDPQIPLSCFDLRALTPQIEEEHLTPQNRRILRQVSSPSDLPELSRASVSSTAESDPKTPGHVFRTNIVRSPSTASSFKESHGFTLSPTLLIPTDFASETEQDAAYEHSYVESSAAKLSAPETFDRPSTPNDDTISSIGSYRSSNYSRGSARSVSTAPSIVTSHLSHDSLVSLNQHLQPSQSSLPDPLPSILRAPEIPPRDASRPKTPAQSRKPSSVDMNTRKDAPLPPTPPHHRRTKAVVLEPIVRKGLNYFAPPKSLVQEEHNLSPVKEDFGEKSRDEKIHGRNISTPVAPLKVEKAFRGRGRSNTVRSDAGKRRTSYVLFPQI